MRLDRLEYQLDAVEKALGAIDPRNVFFNDNPCANPLVRNTPFVDVKMETGTGKTYVYTRLIHSLRQKHGLFKFIILVPSVPIKEGVKMSIASEEWNRHFRQEFGNQAIHLGLINAGDFDAKKGRRKQIPESLRSFCDASRAEDKSIQVLLINDAMLSSISMIKNDYDSTLFGSISCPLEGLKQTAPVVIVDEPHRFNKTNKGWKNITEGLCPPLIIRFGATFPDKKINGRVEKDYENLVYDLNSIRAFNGGLVKGVHIEYPAAAGGDADLLKYRVKRIDRGQSVSFVKSGGTREKERVLRIGEDLSAVDGQFSGGLTLEKAPSADSALLSNDLELHPGMELIPQIFSSGYQELILNQALDAHFKKERENFFRKDAGGKLPRIKTNSLFFIDSIASFRGKGGSQSGGVKSGGEKGWLRLKFEELLVKKIDREIEKSTGEYREFLRATRDEKNERGEMKALAGYFAEDTSKKGDAAIQEEVDRVLRDKERSLQFKDREGKWNVCRFFFSKWTLCEGWDNPNVFVIAKLRSSGSEIRKLQEVGRGLRLPFDETGTRITPERYGEDFRLTYIIDYAEREFAKKLVGEINADGGSLAGGKISAALLEALVKAGYAEDPDGAFFRLGGEKIVDKDKNILDTARLFALLPGGSGFRLKQGVITGGGMPERPKVRLNLDNFRKIKDLWDRVTKRYLIKFETIEKDSLEKTLLAVFSGDDVFVKPSAVIINEYLSGNPARGDDERLVVKTEYTPAGTGLGILGYGDFLKRLNRRTALPLALIHKTIAAARRGKKTPPELFNVVTIEKIIRGFETAFVRIYRQKFSYQSLDYTARTSLWVDGDFVGELSQGCLGEHTAGDVVYDKERYLYDKVVYDSELEHEVLKVKPPARVIVYGKLPRKSIRLPTYTGGTTSPDFVYTIQGERPEEISLHLVVETKSDNPRLSDTVAVEAQEKALACTGPKVKWEMVTGAADFQEKLEKLAGGTPPPA